MADVHPNNPQQPPGGDDDGDGDGNNNNQHHPFHKVAENQNEAKLLMLIQMCLMHVMLFSESTLYLRTSSASGQSMLSQCLIPIMCQVGRVTHGPPFIANSNSDGQRPQFRITNMQISTWNGPFDPTLENYSIAVGRMWFLLVNILNLDASHLCHTSKCCCPHHFALELRSINLDRNRCGYNVNGACLHNPPCLNYYFDRNNDGNNPANTDTTIVTLNRTNGGHVVPVRGQGLPPPTITSRVIQPDELAAFVETQPLDDILYINGFADDILPYIEDYVTAHPRLGDNQLARHQALLELVQHNVTTNNAIRALNLPNVFTYNPFVEFTHVAHILVDAFIRQLTTSVGPVANNLNLNHVLYLNDVNEIAIRQTTPEELALDLRNLVLNQEWINHIANDRRQRQRVANNRAGDPDDGQNRTRAIDVAIQRWAVEIALRAPVNNDDDSDMGDSDNNDDDEQIDP
jgi:hypothetical protein